VSSGTVTDEAFEEACRALNDPTRSIVMPMTVAGWGTRP
jgi:hypothetical protein